MRFAVVLLALLASPCFAAQSHLLTEIRLSWPIGQAGSPLQIRNTAGGSIEVATTGPPLSVDLEVGADENSQVAALAASLTNGVSDFIVVQVGTFPVRFREDWLFGDFDAVDGLGLRRLDYVTRDFPAQATGVDWSKFELSHFHITLVGPISDTLPDRARVVFQVFGTVPEPSTALLLVLGVLSTGVFPRAHRRF